MALRIADNKTTKENEMSKTFEKLGKGGKAKFARELEWHRDQDAIIQGAFSEGEGELFKGCMMGCAVNSIKRINGAKLRHESHLDQAEFLGLPEWLVILYEKIFEGLETNASKNWVIDFFNAVPEGVETEKINSLLTKVKVFIIESTYKNHNNEEVLKAQKQVVDALISGDGKELSAAESAAWSAWSAAESAARSAAESAAWSAWSAAESAARSAAWSAWSAAESARSAAESARSAAWLDLGKKVIELLQKLGVQNEQQSI